MLSFLPEEAILHSDYVVLGEGEEIFPRLVEKLERGEKIETEPGLVIRGEKVSHDMAPMIKDLDSPPIPDFSIVKGMGACSVKGKNVIPVQATRGCPYDCCFCLGYRNVRKELSP